MRKQRPLARAREDAVFAIVCECAETGRIFPNNIKVAEQLGDITRMGALEVLKRLEVRGLITIARYSGSRIITVVETGKRTGGEPGTPHWRHRDAAAAVDVQPQITTLPAKPEPVRVDREPCIRCGTRADIGCKHSRRHAPALSFPSVHR